MPAVGETLRVEGLRELHRAFKVADARLSKQLRSDLRGVAEPVRADAERLAVGAIRRVGIPWSRMRIGVTTTSVYVAPRQRGRRGQPNSRRPNLAGLLMDQAMLPALRQNEGLVQREMEALLTDIGHTWEQV